MEDFGKILYDYRRNDMFHAQNYRSYQGSYGVL